MNTNTIPNKAESIDKLSPLVEQADQALDQPKPEPDGTALFEAKFILLWKEITYSFEKLVQDLRKKRYDVDSEFKKQIEATVQVCRTDTGIPSINEIEKCYQIEKSYEIVYEKYLNKIRAYLSQHLLSLDNVLKRSLDQVKSQVAEILIEQADLAELTEARGCEFIEALAMQIPEQLTPGIPSKLKLAFQMLAEFELSYRGTLHYRIRPQLDGLTPKESKTLKLTKTPSLEQVLLNLRIAHAESLRKCEKALKEFLSEPNQVAFVIVEEFVDRAISTADIENEWRLFLQSVRSQLGDDCQKLGEQTQIQREWINVTQETITENLDISEDDNIFALLDL